RRSPPNSASNNCCSAAGRLPGDSTFEGRGHTQILCERDECLTDRNELVARPDGSQAGSGQAENTPAMYRPDWNGYGVEMLMHHAEAQDEAVALIFLERLQDVAFRRAPAFAVLALERFQHFGALALVIGCQASPTRRCSCDWPACTDRVVHIDEIPMRALQ